MSKKKKNNLWQYLLFGGVLLVLYATGAMPHVIGFVQKGVLKTGLMNPKSEMLAEYSDFSQLGSEENSLQEGRYTKADYNFRLLDENGKIVNLSEFEGKHIFMNFWATWCPPCIAEMPSINELYNEMNDEVVFVMISTDDSFQKADRKSTRLNSSHVAISYAVFCLKKK